MTCQRSPPGKQNTKDLNLRLPFLQSPYCPLCPITLVQRLGCLLSEGWRPEPRIRGLHSWAPTRLFQSFLHLNPLFLECALYILISGPHVTLQLKPSLLPGPRPQARPPSSADRKCSPPLRPFVSRLSPDRISPCSQGTAVLADRPGASQELGFVLTESVPAAAFRSSI